MDIRKNRIPILVGLGLLLLGLLLGNNLQLGGKLVFFKGAPTATDVVEGSYISYSEAVAQLVQAALNAKRIDVQKAKKFLDEADKVSSQTLTRGQFAKLTVQILGLKEYGYGPTLNDIDARSSSARDTYLFTSSGGIEMNFKPENTASKTFVERAITNISARLK